MLVTYSALRGIVAGGFGVPYARVVTTLSQDPDQGLLIYGLLAFVRGVGLCARRTYQRSYASQDVTDGLRIHDSD